MRAQSITASCPAVRRGVIDRPQKPTRWPPAPLYWPWITDRRLGRFSFLTLRDAFRCFMGTEIDMLVVGNSILRKEEQNPALKIDYKDEFELD